MSIFQRARKVAREVVARVRPNYQRRIEIELKNYQQCGNVHELPDIFHYWSNKYLVPMMQPFGFTNPDDFFLEFLKRLASKHSESEIRIASIGSGNSDLEVRLASRLVAAGHDHFIFECLDINPAMHERGRALALAAGLEKHLSFVQADFNAWAPGPDTYQAIIANQSLHHVVELEALFTSIKKGLKDDGLFLVSDMIGRNGHMRWPEALLVVKQFWAELPERYKFNHHMNRIEKKFVNHNCARWGFEGIRAQDILPLLLDCFHFEFFLPYGNVIFPFVDRGFGHNFDANAEWDRNFIDRVHLADEEGLLSSRLKPTSMLAVLSKGDGQTLVRHENLHAKNCIRWPNHKPAKRL